MKTLRTIFILPDSNKDTKRLGKIVTWIRAVLNMITMCVFAIAAIFYNDSIYILRQGYGQFRIFWLAEPVDRYIERHPHDTAATVKLKLVKQLRQYSVDSLGYVPTANYEKIYSPADDEKMWVVTASSRDSISAYKWYFPVIGRVSYKGFFDRKLAVAEFNHLRATGYDAELRTAAAWSTLGWFNDPLLAGMLKRRKGDFCNLIFHELFHATYFKPGDVPLNENLANFIAHKATIRFLANDSTSLSEYYNGMSDERVYNEFIKRKIASLKTYYRTLAHENKRDLLKHKALVEIADSLTRLPVKNKALFRRRSETLKRAGNAYFIGFAQYNSLHDSLEKVFNIIYRGNLEKLVRDLRKD